MLSALLNMPSIPCLIYARLFEQGMEGMLSNADNLKVIISTFWYRECGLLHDYARVAQQLEGGASSSELPDMCRRVRSNAR